MGSSAGIGSEQLQAMNDAARAYEEERARVARSAAREPPPGRGAVIEHDAQELPRRAPYVPRSQRE